jgi:hypothetical protein
MRCLASKTTRGRRRGAPRLKEIIVASLVFLALAGVSLGVLLSHDRLPAHHRHDDTQNVVRLIANIFVVMTSLALGLLLNSAKTKFETGPRWRSGTMQGSCIARYLRCDGPWSSKRKVRCRFRCWESHRLACSGVRQFRLSRAVQPGRGRKLCGSVSPGVRRALHDRRHGRAVQGTDQYIAGSAAARVVRGEQTVGERLGAMSACL